MDEKSIRITVTEASSFNEKSQPPTPNAPQVPEVDPQKSIPETPSNNGQNTKHPSPLDIPKQEEQSKPFFNSLSPTDLKSQTIVSHHSFDGDLESQIFDNHQAQASLSNTGLLYKTSYDPMWPNRHDLKLKRKAIKRERACCIWWADLSRKQRGIISTIVILVVLGAGLSVGFGISKCVGGGVVSSKGPNAPVLFR